MPFFFFWESEPKGPAGSMIPVINKIPQVYTSDGYTWVFVMAGGAALIALLIAVFPKSGRTPCRAASSMSKRFSQLEVFAL